MDSQKPIPSRKRNKFLNLSGKKLGTTSLLEKIGQGSMGAVYRGFQQTLSRPVAVKVVHRSHFDRLVTAQRFKQEAEVAANLDHPGIVTIYEFGERPDLLYFIMQLVEGTSLGQWLKKRKKHPLARMRRFDLDHVLQIATECLEVLQYSHNEGVVHRDIKPENIMWMSKQKRSIITDFGLASVYYSSGNSEKGFVLGSPLYVSPEQARGENVDGRADLFSLACVLLELTLGFLPVKIEKPEKIFRTRARESEEMFTGLVKEHLPNLSDQWDAILRKALSPKPGDRFQNAGEMLKEVKIFSLEQMKT